MSDEKQYSVWVGSSAVNDYYLTNPNPSAVAINIPRDNENLDQLIQSL